MSKEERYARTRLGIATKMYASQKQTSKRRGHVAPTYTKDEFSKWLYSQSNFEELYITWVKSEFELKLKPSVDRLEDDKGYTLTNIQLMTWAENNAKGRTTRYKQRVKQFNEAKLNKS